MTLIDRQAMPIPVLLHAVPGILSQALAEQKNTGGNYVYLTAPPDDITGAAVRLLLLGVAVDVPEKLAVWRTAGLRAPVLLLGTPPEAWPVTETLPLPVKLGRLFERMEYYAQLAAGQGPGEVACGPYRLDPAAKKLYAGPMEKDLAEQNLPEQNLTDKECAILVLFARDPARDWSREELLREVWGYDGALETHTLETHIYRLRRKLADLGGAVDIGSGPGGYRMQGL